MCDNSLLVLKILSFEKQEPAFKSYAPKYTLLIREFNIAPAHITQGSKVTYISQSLRRQLFIFLQAFSIARISLEKLILDARTSADAISADAAKAVNNAREEILSANDRIQTACVNFDSSAASLKACTENLLSVLSEISANLYPDSNEDE